MDNQMKIVLEENVGLKSYIDNMNKECLELNAALFEEANKMVTTALSKQHMAEKKLKEKTQENEMLRAQVQSLREVISKLPSPIEPVSPTHSSSNGSSKRFSSVSRRRQPRSSNLPSTPSLFRKSCENLSLMVASSPGAALTAVSRSDLFAALLAEEEDADEVNQITFQAFCDWIREGCPLSLCQDEEDAVEKFKSDHTTERILYISRSNNKNNKSDAKSISDEENDHGLVSSTQRSDSLPRKSTINPINPFLRYLFEFDIKPCLLFQNAEITEAIYKALPDQSLELTPLTRFGDGTQTKVSREHGKYCPLLPPLEPSYQLSIEDSPCITDGKLGTQTMVVNVSSEARNRIASVVSLFQYLKLIARRCDPISCSSSELSSCTTNTDPLTYMDRTVYEKHFAKIQRIRLGIAFARLGFGIPEVE